jgi:selenocysteine lyase/cysteine desulfurase
MVAAVEYLAGLGRTSGATPEANRREAVVAAFDAIRDHERDLALRFLQGIAALPQIRLWGIGEPDRVDERTPTFAIRVEDQHPEKTATELAGRGIHVWDGHYYAITIMERLGLLDTGGAVRVGFCHYHTFEEVDRVLEALGSLP